MPPHARSDCRNHVVSLTLTVALVTCLFAGSAGGSKTAARPTPGAFEPGETLSLEECLDAAAARSPATAAAEDAWRAAEAGIDRAGSLPDPVLGYGYYVEPVETRVGPQRERWSVRQVLPWFGVLRLRGEAARDAADAGYQRYRAAVLKLRSDVTSAYAEYAYLAEATSILERRADLAASLEAVARSRYAAGEVGFPDVSRSAIQSARLRSDLESLRSRRAPVSSRLAAAIGLEEPGLLPWPEGIVDEPPPPARDEAVDALQAGNPELLALESDVSGARRSLSLARRSVFPDLALGLEYIVTDEASMPVDDSGKDPIVVTASVSIPLWFGKHEGEMRQASARLAAAGESRDDRTKKIEADLDAALYDVSDAARRVALYRDELVPMADQSLASIEKSYSAGSAGFNDLILAEESALEFELGLARARADAMTAHARLAALLGSGVPVEPAND
jgi:cobalt-zinc-cadmium efflux system outer membrane protein